MIETHHKKPIILIVDDVVDNIDVLHELLAQEYKIKASKNKEESETVKPTPLKRKRSLTTVSKKVAMKKGHENR